MTIWHSSLRNWLTQPVTENHAKKESIQFAKRKSQLTHTQSSIDKLTATIVGYRSNMNQTTDQIVVSVWVALK